MMRYKYITGPAVGIEVAGQRVILYPGVEADLPPDDPYVMLFMEYGWLMPV